LGKGKKKDHLECLGSQTNEILFSMIWAKVKGSPRISRVTDWGVIQYDKGRGKSTAKEKDHLECLGSQANEGLFSITRLTG
jgi:hypothetical protein